MRSLRQFISASLLALAAIAVADTDWRTWEAKADEHWLATNFGQMFLTGDPEDNDRVSNDATYGIYYLLNKEGIAGDFVNLLMAVDHGRKIARMADQRYRGQTGWSTARYSRSLISNPSFLEFEPQGLTSLFYDALEVPSASDSTLPAGWTRSQSSSATCYWSASAGRQGGGVVQKTDGINWTSLEKIQSGLTPGNWYFVECMARSDSLISWPNMDVRANDVFLPTTNIDVYDSALGGWQTVSILFQAPADGSSVLLRFVPGSTASGATLSYDDFRISRAQSVRPRKWRQILGDPLATELHPPAIGAMFGEVTLRNSGIDWQTIGQDLFNSAVADNPRYEPSQSYRVWIEAKSHGAPAIATVFNATTGESLAQLVMNESPVYKRASVNFIAPARPNDQLILLLYPGNYQNVGATAAFRRAQVNQHSCYTIDDGQILLSLLKTASKIQTSGLSNAAAAADAKVWVSLAESVFLAWDTDWYVKDDFGAHIMADDGANDFPGATVPLNWLSVMGSVAVELHALTGKDIYRERAGRLAKAVRHSVQVRDGRWNWDYQKELWPDRNPPPKLLSPRSEDVSHANLTVEFVESAFRAGIEFTRADLFALAKTMIDGAWDGNLNAPDIAFFINGSYRNINEMPALWSWIDLIEFDPSLSPIFAMALTPYKEIDYSGPLHSYTGIWYDQGWRVDAKLRLSTQLRKITCLQEADFERGFIGPWNAYDDNGSVGIRAGSGGAKFLSIGADGTDRWKVAQQDIEDPKSIGAYSPGGQYHLYLRYFTEGDLPLYVQVFDWTTNQVLSWKMLSSSEWAADIISFQAPPEPNHRISVRLMPGILGAISGRVNIDDLLLYQAS